MILLGFGSNLPFDGFATPRATLEAVLAALPACGIAVEAVSPWYASAPVPVSDQPWYVNVVARIDTGLSPEMALGRLQGVEAAFGRARGAPNAGRTVDLDLLAWGRLVRTADPPPLLPHPRLHRRAFVLEPLAALVPDWRHPQNGLTAAAMLAALPPGQHLRRLP
ncbi:MAG: 2-amino-4-hydroxy-6-hydroxymethyldihydropteridine diphosphokinase [Alphaproteobacteria bacterium]|nr:2-amino-4-hydroxy-6-hydroxymethyldihydropteridine diphosphokinase [Alphaproteobacteria bacterium]